MNRKRKGSKSDHSQSVAKRPSPGLDIDASSHSSTCPGASRRTRKSAENVGDEIDVSRCCVKFVLEALLMMLELIENGSNASVLGGFTRSALTTMM